ncbi:hypothetical protein D9M69_568680 [compost metagenome]
MASSMILSSSDLVIITTGMFGFTFLISVRVSRPVIPAIISSRKIRSKFCFSTRSSASAPLGTGVTSYPLVSKKTIYGFRSSISSSAHNMVLRCINLSFSYKGYAFTCLKIALTEGNLPRCQYRSRLKTLPPSLLYTR